jgi:hypothetical protein
MSRTANPFAVAGRSTTGLNARGGCGGDAMLAGFTLRLRFSASRESAITTNKTELHAASDKHVKRAR